MKSDIYEFEGYVPKIEEISELASRAASYNGLEKKDELKLVLLSEELIEMLPNLLMCGKGKFWIENSGRNYEIHAVVEADDLLSSKDREDILAISGNKKNAAAVGIMNKIRIAAEIMFANYALSVGTAGDVELEYDDSSDFYEMGMFEDPMNQSGEWSLVNYKKKAKSDSNAWDELEKSIIANMADDVTVGIIGGKVRITIKKAF